MRHRLRTIAATLFVLAAAATGTPKAQDTHYWTQQYGTEGELLLGTVVGSITDLSAVYYNPGTLGLQDNPSLVVGTKAFDYQTIKFVDDEGNQTPLQSRRFGPAPTLFAAILPPKWFEGVVGFSVLTRNDFDFRIEAVGGRGFYVDPPDSVAEVGGEFLIDQDITGVWGGPTWSRAWGKMGVGITGFFAYHGQRTRNQFLAQALTGPPARGASATLIDAIDYWHLRLVFKLGVAWDYSPLTFGFAVTAPGVGLFGEGSSLVDIFINGVDLDGDGAADTELIANSVKDAPAEYRSPGSIAGGMSYRYRNTTFHFTAEYFAKVGRYEVMESVNFESPTTGRTYTHEMLLDFEDALNWGVGIEQRVSPRLKAYGSFITDRSTASDNLVTAISIANWDLYHVMGGAAFEFLGYDITLGVGYSWGRDRIPGHRNLSTSRGLLGPAIEAIDAEVDYRRWRFIVGFAFGQEAK
jgi:hypothetical protein